MLALMVEDVADKVCVSMHAFCGPKPSMLTCKKRTISELFSVQSGENPYSSLAPGKQVCFWLEDNKCSSLCRCFFLLSLEAHAVLKLGPFGGSQSGSHGPAWGGHAVGSEAPVGCPW